MRAILPTTDIAAIPAAPGLRARPARGVPLGSFAELSRQKIVFDLQLADLPVQNIDLRLVGGALRHAAALENAGGAIQQLLLPAYRSGSDEPRNDSPARPPSGRLSP